MKAKTSADYQREFRRRLRESGLIKKEVWIHPDNARQLSLIEKQLRFSANIQQAKGEQLMTDTKQWTNDDLFNALQAEPMIAQGLVTIELIEGADPTLYIIMHEYGDLPIYMNVSGEQIIAESILWAASDVDNTEAFNDAVLRTHKYFPLSTISLEHGPDGKDYYMMFGALSSRSLLSNIVLEISALAANVIQAASAYEEFLNFAQEASI
jgi:hypothetical protein